MTEKELKERTKAFSHRCLDVLDALPKGMVAGILGKQLGRAATSVAANYRAACRGRSKAEFAAKLGIVEEEADECGFWLTLIHERGLVPESKLRPLIQEASEITAIMVASIRSSRR
jgi:four helix bundle protein